MAVTGKNLRQIILHKLLHLMSLSITLLAHFFNFHNLLYQVQNNFSSYFRAKHFGDIKDSASRITRENKQLTSKNRPPRINHSLL